MKIRNGVTKDTIYKIRNHTFSIIVYNHKTSLRQYQSVAKATTNNNACLIIVYNHPTSLRQDQSVAVATTNFA